MPHVLHTDLVLQGGVRDIIWVMNLKAKHPEVLDGVESSTYRVSRNT
jgi:hypothetical protein